MKKEMDSTQRANLSKWNNDMKHSKMEVSKNSKAKETFNRKPYYLAENEPGCEPEYFPSLDD